MPKRLAARSKFNFLYIEDDIASARMLRNVLDDIADVTIATSLHEAETILRGVKFDLVIIDLGLPGVRGFDGVRTVHASTSAPIVIYTGQATPIDETGEEAGRAGADGYLNKDGDIDGLRADVLRILAREHLRRGELALRRGVA